MQEFADNVHVNLMVENIQQLCLVS